MTWIRVEVLIGEDQKVHSLAEQLRVRPNEAVGLLVVMRGKFPDQAPDGDLSKVADTLVEKWAGWHGKAGRFASALRALVLDNAGVDQEWVRTNAAALRARDAAADRMARLRQERALAQAATLELALGAGGSSANGSPNGQAKGSPLQTDVQTKRSTAARARGREPQAYPIGTQPAGSGAPWCPHCEGTLVTPEGQRRPTRVHTDECPSHPSPVTP